MIFDYKYRRRKGVRVAPKQDPYRAPEYTWKHFAAMAFTMWPILSNMIGGAIRDLGVVGVAQWIIAAVVALLAGAHCRWAVTVDEAWNPR